MYKSGNTVHYSPPDLSVVFFLLFVFVVCLVLLSLVAAAFLANKDVYNTALDLRELLLRGG